METLIDLALSEAFQHFPEADVVLPCLGNGNAAGLGQADFTCSTRD